MITTPCAQDPAAWDLSAGRGDLVDQAREAVRWCEVCPGRRACRLFATDNPPEHNTVIGTLVSYEGRLMRFEEFATKMANGPAARVTCGLTGCGEEFIPRSKHHRYCCQEHRDRVNNAPAGAVATIPEPKVCALDGCQVSFVPNSSRHWFCSTSCKKESRRRREAAQREATEQRLERNETAARLVREGHSMRSVATQLGVPYMTVYRAVNGDRAADAVVAA